jgi:hypothetical protein
VERYREVHRTLFRGGIVLRMMVMMSMMMGDDDFDKGDALPSIIYQ